MFAPVERWQGPEEIVIPSPKLALEKLNARARERAAAKRNLISSSHGQLKAAVGGDERDLVAAESVSVYERVADLPIKVRNGREEEEEGRGKERDGQKKKRGRENVVKNPVDSVSRVGEVGLDKSKKKKKGREWIQGGDLQDVGIENGEQADGDQSTGCRKKRKGRNVLEEVVPPEVSVEDPLVGNGNEPGVVFSEEAGGRNSRKRRKQDCLQEKSHVQGFKKEAAGQLTEDSVAEGRAKNSKKKPVFQEVELPGSNSAAVEHSNTRKLPKAFGDERRKRSGSWCALESALEATAAGANEEAPEKPAGQINRCIKKETDKSKENTVLENQLPDEMLEQLHSTRCSNTGLFVENAPNDNVADHTDIVPDRNAQAILIDKLTSKSPANDLTTKGPPVLPWMRDPVEINLHKDLPLDQVPRLDPSLQVALRNSGIEKLFPVQVALWHEIVGPGMGERDLCVSSPTGSGKTLAYALPIVQKLANRTIKRLRALVVLPTRDLAAQVKAVFDTIAPAVDLSVGLAVGQTPIAVEAAKLVRFRQKMVHSFGEATAFDHDVPDSSVDVLVATPGRLMDHLQNTRGFTLQHLYYLVVDETDRLLRQAYQDWLPNVIAAVAAPHLVNSSASQVNSTCSKLRPMFTDRQPGFERGFKGTTFPRFTKLVLSATLTRDPAKISQLALHRPLYIASSALDNRYHLPEQLQSYKLVCKAGEKPLYLAALLRQLAGQQTIVFTASVIATHRLFMLLCCFKDLSLEVVEYSSLQHQLARSKSLNRFRAGQAQVLVASDAMTRGMDVQGIANVINYDVPVYAKTYVHRVGRTARAGRSGCTFTLLRREEVRHLKQLLKKADNSSCKDYRLPPSSTQELYPSYLTGCKTTGEDFGSHRTWKSGLGYQTALERLKEVLAKESNASGPAGRQIMKGEDGAIAADELFMGQ